MGLGTYSKEEEPDLEGPTAQLVKNLISSDGIVIFSKTYCPYCKMAKEVFDSINCKYTVIELDKREDAAAIQSILGKMTGAKTVPRVFVNGQCIGGGNEVKRLHEGGNLLPLLEKFIADYILEGLEGSAEWKPNENEHDKPTFLKG